jgi:DNA repair protein RadC
MIPPEKLSIKKWAEEDRPREKMLKHGFAALSNAELIAILIGSGNRNESAVELSRRILADFDNNIDKLSNTSVEALIQYNGMGQAKAINVLAALELGKRRQLLPKNQIKKITSSADVYNVMARYLEKLPHEEFWVLFLNRANNIIDKAFVSKGGISGTVVDVRVIIKQAIDKQVSSLILVHNHPSGNLNPSKADIDITRKISEAANFFELKVLDHIIISRNGFKSFADEGLI